MCKEWDNEEWGIWIKTMSPQFDNTIGNTNQNDFGNCRKCPQKNEPQILEIPVPGITKSNQERI